MDGAVVRDWRRSRGWDVPEMARQLRLAAGGSSWLSRGASADGLALGTRGMRIERYALLYAKALGVSPDDLASGPAKPAVSSVLPGVGSEVGDDPVKRREFGIVALGALAGAVVPPGEAPRPSSCRTWPSSGTSGCTLDP